MLVNLASLRESAIKSGHGNFQYDSGDPRRLNPLSLEQQKKRAKELLRALQQSDPAALKRISNSEAGSETEFHLHDAQKVIALENGFSGWPALKAHIEYETQVRNSLTHGGLSAPDAKPETLHIRCGSDITHALAIAGFVSDFLVFPDPYVEGPVPVTKTLEEFVRIRSRYLSDNVTPREQEMNQILTKDYAELDTSRNYSRVMLWFEHDPYDQLCLAMLLDYFSDAVKRPQSLQLICIEKYPGVKRFNGIGQLPPETMPVLWKQFAEVTETQLFTGKQAWDAIRSDTPEKMVELVKSGTPALPTMAKSLARFIQQLPSARNGLNLTEQLTLQILSDHGPMFADSLFFKWYANHYEPLPFLGDTQYWRILKRLTDADHPAVAIEKKGEQPRDWHVELTDIGRQVLAGQLHWLELNRLQYWVGGVLVDSARPNAWCYDPQPGLVLKKLN